MEPLLIPIEAAPSEPSAMLATGLSRSGVYQVIRSGQLKTVKVGRRRFTTMALILEFVDSLEVVDGPDAA